MIVVSSASSAAHYDIISSKVFRTIMTLPILFSLDYSQYTTFYYGFIICKCYWLSQFNFSIQVYNSLLITLYYDIGRIPLMIFVHLNIISDLTETRWCWKDGTWGFRYGIPRQHSAEVIPSRELLAFRSWDGMTGDITTRLLPLAILAIMLPCNSLQVCGRTTKICWSDHRD